MGSSYTRYKIPFDTLSGIERVLRVRRHGGDFRIVRGVKGSREFPFQGRHGADLGISSFGKSSGFPYGGVRLQRGGRKRSYNPLIRNVLDEGD